MFLKIPHDLPVKQILGPQVLSDRDEQLGHLHMKQVALTGEFPLAVIAEVPPHTLHGSVSADTAPAAVLAEPEARFHFIRRGSALSR